MKSKIVYIKIFKLVMFFCLLISFVGINAQNKGDLIDDDLYNKILNSSSQALFKDKKSVYKKIAHQNKQRSSSIVINEGVSVLYSCTGSSLLYVSSDRSSEYSWYDSGFNLIGQGPEITVTSSGSYTVFDKNFNGQSIDVIVLPNELVINSSIGQTNSSGVVATCSSQSPVLSVNLKGAVYFLVQWYYKRKIDDEFSLISGANKLFLETKKGEEQYGYYKVVVSPKEKNDSKNTSCNELSSKELKIISKENSTFAVRQLGKPNRVFLPNATISETLAIEHEATANVQIDWFKNGALISGSRNLSEITIFTSGTYHAEVVERLEGGCDVLVKSGDFKIVEPLSFNVVLGFDEEYQECVSESSSVLIDNVYALNDKGEEFELDSDQLSLLQYNWSLNDKPLNVDPKQLFYIAKSFNDNGNYTVECSYTVNSNWQITGSTSEVLTLSLITNYEPYFNLTTTTGTAFLCPSGSMSIFPEESNPNFTYQWYKNGKPLGDGSAKLEDIKESGTYELVTNIWNCENKSAIEISPFTEDIVPVEPGTILTLIDVDSVQAVASGADTYQWFYDKDGTMVSDTDTLNAKELGTYTLVATIGTCAVEKVITVTDDDLKNKIPNILTPFNSDGVNDFFVLPNRLAFNKDVNVIIFDSNGVELLNVDAYQNNWPKNKDEISDVIYYFKITKKDKLIKAGTLSVLQE